MPPKRYGTMDNGGKAFRVTVRGDAIDVAVLVYDYDDDGDDEKPPTPKHCFSLIPQKVFVGRSPNIAMTRFSGAIGPKFDGNSILIELDDSNRYLHIGSEVIGFRAPAKITTYVSPVGNSGVPYPYAIDKRGAVHLLLEGVTMTGVTLDADDEPYHTYYRKSLITPDLSFVEPVLPEQQFEGISEFFIGKRKYTMTYKPHAALDYDDVLKRLRAKDMHVVKNGERVALPKDAYVALMKRFGKSIGCCGFRSIKFVDGEDGRGSGSSSARIRRWIGDDSKIVSDEVVG
jgi:hypothetical protein